MYKTRFNFLIGFLTAAVLLPAGIVYAQDALVPDPAAVDTPAAAPAAVPAGAKNPSRQDGPTAAADAPFVPTVKDPAVDTIVDSNPKTPAELLRAAAILADLNRIDLAKKYLQQMSATPTDERALADAALQLDPSMLLRLAGNKDLQPEARTLVDGVMAAGAKAVRDPQRLQVEINKLINPSSEIRRESLRRILAAHEDAVPALVVALGDKSRARLFPIVKQVLATIGREAIPPLAASLQSEDAAQVANVVDALAEIGSRDAVIYLLAPTTAESYPAEVRQAGRSALNKLLGVKDPTPTDAATLLTAEIEKILNNERTVYVNSAGKAEQWIWNSQLKAPVRETVPVSLAVSTQAARLASDLWAIDPQGKEANRLFLISTLNEVADRTAPDAPLQLEQSRAAQRVAALGPARVEDGLATAMSRGFLDAARVAAEILGNTGDASLVASTDSEMRPLVRAVAQGDRRLRFAAAEAIMKLKPQGQFAGSSHLTDALVFFAESPGVRRAIIAFPTERIAGDLATLLGAQGYEVDAVSNGHKCLLQAQRSGDYELILITGRIDHPPVWVTIQQLRHEPASARLPIGLMGEPGDLPYLDSVASEDGSNRSPPRSRMTKELNSGIDKPLPDSQFGDGSLTAVFDRPLTPEAMKFFVDRLIAQAGQYVVPASVRQKQAVAALGWLKQLYEADPVVFALRPYERNLVRVLENPTTSTGAAELLALIGSQRAQRALLEVANRATEPLPLRQSAAAAFSQAVRHYGIQMTSREIEDQYARYNGSANEDAEVQKLLALILDAIEAPTKRMGNGEWGVGNGE